MDPLGTPPSLLWPPGSPRTSHSQGLTAQQALDLGLDVLVRELDWEFRHTQHIRTVLMALVADPAVIRYRQAIAAELATREHLRNKLAAQLPSLAELGQPRSAAWARESPLLLIPPRLSDLELYVSCVQELHEALIAEAGLEASGLRALQAYVAAIQATDEFQSLVAELPALRSQLDQAASVTVGINLDRDLRPASATLVAINHEPFTGTRSLAQRLLGQAAPTEMSGATALRHVPEHSPETSPLGRDLQKLLTEVVEPIAVALERYSRIHARPLAALEAELAFYLGAVRLMQRLAERGLPMSLPEPSEQSHVLADAYNPALVFQMQSQTVTQAAPVVCNLIDFDQGRIVYLTGPNRGGKTTYLRAIGLNQVLFQAGVWVAARAARIVPVDAILTHFPLVEGVEPGIGRLDDEARRIRAMFVGATPKSLLLFNEPLTSTSEGEALTIAGDLLRALRLLAARTVYVTHLHGLANELPKLNQLGSGATITSWVAGVGQGDARTYRIQPGLPTTRSHAATIAEQQGITFAQLTAELVARGMIVADVPPAE